MYVQDIMKDDAKKMEDLSAGAAMKLISHLEYKQFQNALQRIGVANDPVGQSVAHGYHSALEELRDELLALVERKRAKPEQKEISNE